MVYLIHNVFEYNSGLNVDILPFNPYGSFSYDSFYLCEEYECYNFWLLLKFPMMIQFILTS
jgi:hypothetical protein